MKKLVNARMGRGNVAFSGRPPRARAGQTSFMVMLMMIIAIMLAMFFWLSAGSDFAQNAASAARNRGSIFGRTGGDVVSVGVGRQAGAAQGLPAGAFTPNAPLGPVPPPPTLGRTTPGGPGGTIPGGPGGAAPGPQPGPGGGLATGPGGAPGGAAPGPQGLSPQLGKARGGFVTDAPWINQLFQTLNGKLGAAPGQILEVQDVPLSDLGQQLKSYIGADVPGLTLDKVDAKITNIRRDLPFASQGLFDDKSYYREPLFGDGNAQAGNAKDVRPQDFLADLVVNFTIRSTAGGQSRSLSYTRVMDVRIADTTPVAREFALFAYEPPHTQNYMMNDLNGPGWMAVSPNSNARVMVRGPLMLKVEDCTTDVALGGETRTEESHTFPSNEKGVWSGFAAVPAPRAVDMPKLAFSIGDLISGIGGWLGGNQSSPFDKPSERPVKKDTALFKNPIPFLPDFPGVWLIGIVPDYKGENINFGGSLSGFAGVYQPLPPSEHIALAGPSAYYAGVLPVGQQRFSITGLSKKMQDNMKVSIPWNTDSINPYYGVVLHKDDQSAEAIYTQAPVPPSANDQLLGKSNTNVKLQGDDLLSPEPVYYAKAGNNGGARFANGLDPSMTTQAAGDQGIYGVYGIANYKRTIYWMFDIPSLIRTICNIAKIGAAVSWVGTFLTGGLAAPAAIAASAGAAESQAMETGADIAVKEGSKSLIKALGGKISKACTLALIPMNYKVESPDAPAANWTPGTGDKNLTIAPYGLYRDGGQGAWADEAVRDVAYVATAVGLNIGLKKLFSLFQKAKPADEASNIADATSQKETAELAGDEQGAQEAAAKEGAAANRTAEDAAKEARSSLADANKVSAEAIQDAKRLNNVRAAALKEQQSAVAEVLNANKALAKAADGSAEQVAAQARLAAAEARKAAAVTGFAQATEDLKAAQQVASDANTALEGVAKTDAAWQQGMDALKKLQDQQSQAEEALKQATQARVTQEGNNIYAVGKEPQAYLDKISQLNEAEAAAKAKVIDVSNQLADAQAGAQRAADASVSKGTAEAVSTTAQESAVMGEGGIVSKLTDGWKKFAPNVWNKFRTGVMTAGGIFPKLLQVLQKNGLNNNTVAFGIAIGLVKQLDNNFLRGHSSDTRAKLEPQLAPKPTSSQAQDVRASLDKDFPKGYLPPKYRYFPSAYAFTYKSMDQYLAQFGNTGGDQLEVYLNGIARVEDMNYSHPNQIITYHGRGIIVGIPTPANATQNPVFNVKAVRANDDNSFLTLVYEAPSVNADQDVGIGQLLMGPEFTGCIVSSQGVRPAQGVNTTIIHGNLVCRHLNKSKMADSDGVIVNYVNDRMSGLGWDIQRWWGISVSPKLSGFAAAQ